MIFGIDRHPADSPAIIDDGGTFWNYGQLVREVSEFKNVVHERSLIFCLCRNEAACVAGYLGFLEQGSVPALLSHEPDPALLENLIKTYQPAYIWRPLKDGKECQWSGESKNREDCRGLNAGKGLEGSEELLKSQKIKANEEKNETCENRKNGALIYKLGSYGLFKMGYESPSLDRELSLLLSSSGTTGSPKLIKLSKKNLESNSTSISEYLELDENERPVTVLPMHYTFGLSVINSHLHSGACVLMTRSSIVNQEFWDFLSEHKGTSLSGVPYTYELLRRIRFTQRDDISSITSMIQAGGHLPVELQNYYGKWSREHGVKFFIMYGQTEATARMSYLPYEDILRKPDSIGVPIPGGRFEILDTQGNIITAADEAGELVYYGDNVSLGYAACREDLNKPDERHGRLLTGDLASIDSEGYYYIRGRLSRFVKLYGNRVSLDECEKILKGLDVDAEFACTGEDDQLAVFTDSQKYEEAPAYLSERLKINIRAFRAFQVESIPTTESGKPDYKTLKNYLSNHIESQI